jgi:DNA gyrase subunit A
MGVIGMTLTGDDQVVGMQLDTQGQYLLFVSEFGLGKRTDMEEFTVQHRGGKGVKCYKITEKTGDVVGVKAVNENNEVILISTEGIIIRLLVSDISVLGRITSGVKLMAIDMDTDITVANFTKVRESNTAPAAATEEEVIKNLEKELDEDNIALEPVEYPEDKAEKQAFEDESFVKESYEDQLEENNQQDF